MQEDHFQMEGFCMDTANALAHQTPESKGGGTNKSKDKSAAASKTTLGSVGEGPASTQMPVSSAGGHNLTPRQLSISGIEDAEDGMVSCCLTEELLVDILVNRLQLEDCRYGGISL
ncbi:hypothetical protein ACOMHN_059334 [Nucella lapillus]